MITLTYESADSFVAKQQRLGNDVRWVGWDIVFFKPVPNAFRDPRGVRNATTGEWGYETVVRVNKKGTWKIDYRNVRRASSTRN